MTDASEQYVELFDFLTHPRDDVCKMAASGLAAESKDNTALVAFVCAAKHSASVDKLVTLLTDKKPMTLGDALTVCVNLAADSRSAEVLTRKGAAMKAMSLFEGLESSSNTAIANALPALRELSLMLLSNLTASTPAAVDQLMQVEDEDLAGYYLGRLHTHYTRAAPSEEGAMSSTQRWVLSVLLNASRVEAAQRLLAADEDDWMPELTSALDAEATPSLQRRALAAQIIRNVAATKATHAALVNARAVGSTLKAVCEPHERNPVQLDMLLDTVKLFLSSEEGMASLEGTNAKKLFTSALAADADAPEGTARFTSQQADVINNEILKFLDDVEDVWVNNGAAGEQ